MQLPPQLGLSIRWRLMPPRLLPDTGKCESPQVRVLLKEHRTTVYTAVAEGSAKRSGEQPVGDGLSRFSTGPGQEASAQECACCHQ